MSDNAVAQHEADMAAVSAYVRLFRDELEEHLAAAKKDRATALTWINTRRAREPGADAHPDLLALADKMQQCINAITDLKAVAARNATKGESA